MATKFGEYRRFAAAPTDTGYLDMVACTSRPPGGGAAAIWARPAGPRSCMFPVAVAFLAPQRSGKG
jgi:hypothetical protein